MIIYKLGDTCRMQKIKLIERWYDVLRTICESFTQKRILTLPSSMKVLSYLIYFIFLTNEIYNMTTLRLMTKCMFHFEISL